MRYQFNWDGTETTMVDLGYTPPETLERLLPKWRKAFAAHLELFANGDELDAVESEWWVEQDGIQRGTILLTDRRDELEAEYPHLPAYRGEAASARPDYTATVLADCKTWAKKWYKGKRDLRLDHPTTTFTVGADTVLSSAYNQTVALHQLARFNSGVVWEVARMEGPDGEAVVLSDEAEFLTLADMLLSEARDSAMWWAAQLVDIDAAVDVDAVLAELVD